jgi:chromosome segregation ATPase
MKKVYLLAILLTGTFACTTIKDSDDYRKLATEKNNLEEQIRLRDKEIEEVTGSISKIDSNLMKISEHVEVMDGVKLRELIKKPGEIDLMISEIGDYVEQNNQMITNLEKKVQESTTINSNLKSLIAMKNQQVEEKEKQIQDLLASIERMQKDFDVELGKRDTLIAKVRNQITETETVLANTKEKVKEKEEELNTAFVTFGTKQELSQKGVLQSGSKVVLNNQLEENDFSPVNIQNTEEVNLGVTKRQKVVTSHPTDSYYFVKTDGRSYLKIVDRQKFWSVSKYLVVMIDN